MAIKTWIEWIEPYGPNNEPVYMRVEDTTAIAVMKAMHPDQSDVEALDDFIVCNWATVKKEVGHEKP